MIEVPGPMSACPAPPPPPPIAPTRRLSTERVRRHLDEVMRRLHAGLDEVEARGLDAGETTRALSAFVKEEEDTRAERAAAERRDQRNGRATG